VVGAFMQQGQRAKLIDAKAEFPQVVRDPPEAPASAASMPDTDTSAADAGSGLARILGLPLPAPRAPQSPAEAAAEKQQRDQALGR
jgi:hypothetical protein